MSGERGCDDGKSCIVTKTQNAWLGPGLFVAMRFECVQILRLFFYWFFLAACAISTTEKRKNLLMTVIRNNQVRMNICCIFRHLFVYRSFPDIYFFFFFFFALCPYISNEWSMTGTNLNSHGWIELGIKINAFFSVLFVFLLLVCLNRCIGKRQTIRFECRDAVSKWMDALSKTTTTVQPSSLQLSHVVYR